MYEYSYQDAGVHNILFNSGNYSVEANAIDALMEINDNRAVQPLIEKLSSENTLTNARVVNALAKFKDDSAIESMTELLIEMYPKRKYPGADALIAKLIEALEPYNTSKIN